MFKGDIVPRMSLIKTLLVSLPFGFLAISGLNHNIHTAVISIIESNFKQKAELIVKTLFSPAAAVFSLTVLSVLWTMYFVKRSYRNKVIKREEENSEIKSSPGPRWGRLMSKTEFTIFTIAGLLIGGVGQRFIFPNSKPSIPEVPKVEEKKISLGEKYNKPVEKVVLTGEDAKLRQEARKAVLTKETFQVAATLIEADLLTEKDRSPITDWELSVKKDVTSLYGGWTKQVFPWIGFLGLFIFSLIPLYCAFLWYKKVEDKSKIAGETMILEIVIVGIALLLGSIVDLGLVCRRNFVWRENHPPQVNVDQLVLEDAMRIKEVRRLLPSVIFSEQILVADDDSSQKRRAYIIWCKQGNEKYAIVKRVLD